MRRLLVLLALIPGTARADGVAAQLTATASTGYTDNAAAVDEIGRQGDLVMTIRPSLALIRQARRGTQILTLSAYGTKYLEATGGDSYAARLDLATSHELSRRSSLGLSAGASLGRSLLSAQLPATGEAVALVPGGRQTFAEAVFGQSFRHEFTPSWSGTEDLRLSGYRPLDSEAARQTSGSAELSLGAQHSWRNAALSVQARGNVFAYLDLETAGVLIPGREDAFVALAATWLQELSPSWALMAGVGPGLAIPLSTDADPVFVPVAMLEARWTGPRMVATLRASHDVRPNLLLAQTVISDDVTAGLAYPFDALARLVATAQAGYAHARQLDTDGSSDTLRAGLSVTYRLRDELTLGASYELGWQHTSGGSSDFLRNAVTLNVTVVYPLLDRKPTVQRPSDLTVRQDEPDPAP